MIIVSTVQGSKLPSFRLEIHTSISGSNTLVGYPYPLGFWENLSAVSDSPIWLQEPDISQSTAGHIFL